MNKTELRNFAINARRDLLEKVALRAKIFGIDEKNDLTIEEKFGHLAINGETYSIDKKSALLSLKKQLESKGYEQLIEEVAYTWFNRIIALRYMEVNEYLPERVNVLSSSTGKIEPDILSEFETMELDIDTAKIKGLIRQGETEDAYRKLFIAHCNALNKILPFMFEKIHDYTELLLPDFLLDSESVITKLVSNGELTDSFKEVEVIGWLYQFYNSEPKDKVFANLKKNKKIEKYDIPAATQLFTPKWIVQYMVENSLGQLWIESNPDSTLKEKMHYYIQPTEQDEEVKQKLEEIRYKNVNLEEITIIDPCVGSGHILVYAFELLYQMYEEAGYPSSDISKLILEKNLFGLDIDDRAVQLASFALLMKARDKSRRIFRQKIELNILAIQESNHIDKEGIAQLLSHNEQEVEEIYSILSVFNGAKNIGSILKPEKINYQKYLNRITNLGEMQLTANTYQAYDQLEEFIILLKQAIVLVGKYDISVTNPPYMGSKGINKTIQDYLKIQYPDSKTDLFAVFIERSLGFIRKNGFSSMITMESWMFLSSFQLLRNKLLDNIRLYNLIHMPYEGRGRTSLGINFGTSAFIMRNSHIGNYKGIFQCIHHFEIDHKGIPFKFPLKNDKYNILPQEDFKSFASSTISYWASEKINQLFAELPPIGDYLKGGNGMTTGENDSYLRMWYEVNYEKIGFNFENKELAKKSGGKWFPYVKGGPYNRWYGNLEYVINWENDGELIRNNGRSFLRNQLNYFKKGLSWSKVTSGKFSVRYTPPGMLFDVAGMSLFPKENESIHWFIGFLNSKVATSFVGILSQSMNFESGTIKSLPYKKEDNPIFKDRVIDAINLSKSSWDSFETSWDFKQHPFLIFQEKTNLNEVFREFALELQTSFAKQKENEETLNKLFINLYGLQDELSYEVNDAEINIRQENQVSDVKSFLSYFIGCVMGRYSVDVEGLSYAGGKWDESKYNKFKPNKFGLIQLTDDYYFENDIIARLREFLAVTFSEENVEENLQWLAESLELKRNETAEERLRRYFLDEFFKDHCQVYQKRPIYWLVDSGRQKGLRTLIYMHRYQLDTMATIRFEHLQEIQAKYNNEISAIDLRIVNPNLSATEKRELEKRKTNFQKRLEELLEFDKKLAEYANAQIEIDLDDGVKVNYAEFDKVLAKIR